MLRKYDAVSRAVARISQSQRNNDVARPENIDHTGVAQRKCKHSSMYGSAYPSRLRKDAPCGRSWRLS
ncbi:hypothetical protein ALC60_07766 [Trachymyrmex zeteki]|uniref:Uncharacterized protein n=1 Tax=Mycetomoellerius zeteki TaxID=64791 RepID=A0A151WYT6_9HYME|nr:hypothetical protein ALC60_07766 [Trachymyrmex zeteki]